GTVDRGHERRVHLGHAVIVEAHDHAAEARVVRDILRLHAVQDELPAGPILGGELGHAIDRVAHGTLVPRRKDERAGAPHDVVRVRAVLHLRLEPLALVAECLEDRSRAVGEGKRPRQDLDDGPATRTPVRLNPPADQLGPPLPDPAEPGGAGARPVAAPTLGVVVMAGLLLRTSSPGPY